MPAQSRDGTLQRGQPAQKNLQGVDQSVQHERCKLSLGQGGNRCGGENESHLLKCNKFPVPVVQYVKLPYAPGVRFIYGMEKYYAINAYAMRLRASELL
jgi:hypothetical protein